MVVANLDKGVSFSSRSLGSVSSLSRGLLFWNSAIRFVLKTSNPVTLACTGAGNAARERVSARCREVPFLYVIVKRYLCSLISIFCSLAGALLSGFFNIWFQVAGGRCTLLCQICRIASGRIFQRRCK